METAATSFERLLLRPDLRPARPDGSRRGARNWRRRSRSPATICRSTSLRIEPKTAFYRRAQAGEALILDEDGTAALYELTQAVLDDASMPAYEISNHARPGNECRHNLVYWRYGDYVGVGPGAHGRITADGAKIATQRIRSPEGWLDALESGQDVLAERTLLDPRERFTEMVMMGLRLAEGIPLARVRAECGDDAATWIDKARLNDLVDAGYLDPSPDHLRATVEGRERLDAVLAHLIA